MLSCLLWHLNQTLASSRCTHGRDLQYTGPDKIKFKQQSSPQQREKWREREIRFLGKMT